ncbi:MAG: hypothetical protein ABIJ56_16655 [Pseudomonadota bacterium]
MRLIIITALMLLGPAGCYESSRAGSNLPDADSDGAADALMDQDTGPVCALWGVTVFVDYVQSLSPPVDGFVTVTLRGGQEFQLNVRSSLGELWAEILESYRERHEPVYLEIDDPRTLTIIDVLMPLESPLHDIRPAEDGVEVVFIYSAAIHFLYRSHPCYEQMLGVLETARSRGLSVLATTDFNNGNRILDARTLLEP